MLEATKTNDVLALNQEREHLGINDASSHSLIDAAMSELDWGKSRSRILSELKFYMSPPTGWEAELHEHIQTLDCYDVPRADPDLLLFTGFKLRASHENCFKCEKSGGVAGVKSVPGWWKLPTSIYIPHCVLSSGYGRLVCITPYPELDLRSIEFIPDPNLVWTGQSGSGGVYSGREVPRGVRANPVKAIAEATAALQNLHHRLIN